MIQEALDKDVLAHAEQVCVRHSSSISENAAVSELIETVRLVADALRRHQPVVPQKGWDDAWNRFDKGNSAE